MTLVPDLAEPVAGWRIWRVVDGEDGPELLSPIRPQLWAHRRPTSATCEAGCRPCPSPTCHCGLYAMDAPDRLLLGHEETAVVLGCVALWGRVVEHTSGWRGELGYPLVLLVLSPRPVDLMRRMPMGQSFLGPSEGDRDAATRALADELADLYAVPVHPARSLTCDGMTRPRHARRVVAREGAAAALRAEAVAGLADRRAGDPAARARLDRRMRNLVDASRG